MHTVANERIDRPSAGFSAGSIELSFDNEKVTWVTSDTRFSSPLLLLLAVPNRASPAIIQVLSILCSRKQRKTKYPARIKKRAHGTNRRSSAPPFRVFANEQQFCETILFSSLLASYRQDVQALHFFHLRNPFAARWFMLVIIYASSRLDVVLDYIMRSNWFFRSFVFRANRRSRNPRSKPPWRETKKRWCPSASAVCL
jgi:hypothetical protein